MATVVERERLGLLGRTGDVRRSDPRPSGAVQFWATVGGVVLLFAVYAFIRWITSADFAAPDPGPDHYPYLLWLRTAEVLSVLAVMAFLWLKAIRPWITERRVPFDGKLLLGLMTAYVVDPILNFYNHDFAMNAHSVSFGAWSN